MFRWKRRDSEPPTDIDRLNNDCAMNSERSVLVKGSDPPQGHRVHTMVCDMWRVLARRMMKKYDWLLVCTTQMTKFLDPSRMVKNSFFFRFGRRP